MKVEIDSKGSLSKEKIEQMMADAREEALQEIKDEDATLTLGAIGSCYNIGGVALNISIGNIVLLNEIDSPFITGEIGEEGEELDSTECIKGLYVLANGKNAVKPIMAIKQRIQSLNQLKPMVEKNPDLFDKLMDRAESISEAYADFELAAFDWYEANFAGKNFQDIVDDMFYAMSDILKVAGDLPDADPDSKKK